MALSSFPANWRDSLCLWWNPSITLLQNSSVDKHCQRALRAQQPLAVQATLPSAFPITAGGSLRNGGEHATVCGFSNPINFLQTSVMWRPRSSLSRSHVRAFGFHAPDSLVSIDWKTRVSVGDGVVQQTEENIRQENLEFETDRELQRDQRSDESVLSVSSQHGEDMTSRSVKGLPVLGKDSLSNDLLKLDAIGKEDVNERTWTESHGFSFRSSLQTTKSEIAAIDDKVKFQSSESMSGTVREALQSTLDQANSHSDNLSGGKNRSGKLQGSATSLTGFNTISFGGGGFSKYEREMDAAVRAVQLASVLSQKIQRRILQNEEKTDFKKDRSLVTVADWGVQAVVSWVLSEAFQGEEIPMIAEEDTTGLRGMGKVDLLQRVVATVNECLEEARMVGISPPAHPLGAVDVLKAISKGSAEGGPKGRYWVLDPVDGTLGFVRGDQYAVALAMIEDGEVVLAVLGCPNFPLRKQWLKHHHRYYRIASRLSSPNPTKWHKGLILSATKGGGQVIMQPLVVNSDGVPQWENTGHMAHSITVSPEDDPASATFCEPVEKANSSHSFTAGLAEQLGLRNRPLRVYSMAKYAAIARGDAEIFMKFAKAGYREKIWDHAAGMLIVQEAGGVVTDAGGKPLDFSQGRFLEGLDRGIIVCSGKSLHEKLLKAVDASWNSSTL